MQPKEIVKEKVDDLASYIHLVTKLNSVAGLSSATSQLWFRGQGDKTWDLNPNSYRSKNLNFFEREMLRDFKLLSNKLIEKKPENELEWLFLMQHYGLGTRLLDWSESHLVALYFAVVDYQLETDATVWILHPWSLNNVSIGQRTIPTSSHPDLVDYTLPPPHLVDRKIKAHFPVAVRPLRNSPRIVAQKGTFTIHGYNEKPLNQLIEECNSKGGKQIQLYSLTIDGKSKLKILKELYLAGISYSVIFPEMQGICNDIKIRYSDDFTFPVNTDKLKP